jgi:hypothetical protein
MAKIEVDLSELAQQAEMVGHKLGELLSQVEHTIEEQQAAEKDDDDESLSPEPAEEPRLSQEDEQKIEQMFAQAGRDRSKAYVLKGQLDRLGVFDLYEDRFLDLFKKRGE